MKVSITLERDDAVWKSDYIRNGFDKAKPYLDWAGTGLTAASLVLAANPNTGLNTNKRATALSGAGLILASSILQHFFGAKNLNDAAGTVNTVNANVAQLMMSREAYTQLQDRLTKVSKTLADVSSQVDDITSIQNDCRTVQGKILNDPGVVLSAEDLQTFIDLVERTSAAREKYQVLSTFVSTYTDDLIQLYTQYKSKYPPLSKNFDEDMKTITEFHDLYESKITNGLLKRFPQAAGTLSDLRAQLRDEKTP